MGAVQSSDSQRLHLACAACGRMVGLDSCAAAAGCPNRSCEIFVMWNALFHCGMTVISRNFKRHLLVTSTWIALIHRAMTVTLLWLGRACGDTGWPDHVFRWIMLESSVGCVAVTVEVLFAGYEHLLPEQSGCSCTVVVCFAHCSVAAWGLTLQWPLTESQWPVEDWTDDLSEAFHMHSIHCGVNSQCTMPFWPGKSVTKGCFDQSTSGVQSGNCSWQRT